MTPKEKQIETFYPASVQEWRLWLQQHHDKKPSIWIVCYKKETGIPTITWSEAVDEALCFGWIDSTRRSVDSGSFIQFFTRRKPTSTWSRINKEKVDRLTAEGRMTPAGQEVIEKAKKNGSWELLDQVEDLAIPKEMEKEFKLHPGSKDFFLGLSRSVRKQMLHWVTMAKLPETKHKRIKEIVTHAAQQQRAPRFR
ncbi:YdeI/OmpD-associated family protein [Nemorincola caseinilytica]|uniref:YdeI/OmpD-associated family protein n=1 Tax=Nemorincola caseinilytica TaxID=2054315 RepID=A0ABP8NR00_9BACT